MIAAHTPVGTVIFVLQGMPHVATVNAELWQAGDQWIVGTDRKTSGGETFKDVVNAENCYALADLVAQASWNGADVLKALGLEDIRQHVVDAEDLRQAKRKDRPFTAVLRDLGRDEDLRELEALRVKAAKWDNLQAGLLNLGAAGVVPKPQAMPPAPDLVELAASAVDALERIADAVEGLEDRIGNLTKYEETFGGAKVGVLRVST